MNALHSQLDVMMETTTLHLPTDAALEHEIEEIEASYHDAHIKQAIVARVAMADAPDAVFVSHNEAFAASRDRLMAKLHGKVK